MYKLVDIFKDKKNIKTLFLLCLFMSLAFICFDLCNLHYTKNIFQYIFISILNVFFISVPYGYFTKLVNDILTNDENRLQNIEILEDFKLGLKYFIAIAFPFLILIIIKLFLMHLNKSFFKSIETPFIFSFLIPFFILLPAFICIFSTKKYFTSFILIKKAFFLMKNNIYSYIKILLVFLVLLLFEIPIGNLILKLDNAIDNDLLALLIIQPLNAIKITIAVFITCVFFAQSIKKEDITKI